MVAPVQQPVDAEVQRRGAIGRKDQLLGSRPEVLCCTKCACAGNDPLGLLGRLVGASSGGSTDFALVAIDGFVN